MKTNLRAKGKITRNHKEKKVRMNFTIRISTVNLMKRYPKVNWSIVADEAFVRHLESISDQVSDFQ